MPPAGFATRAARTPTDKQTRGPHRDMVEVRATSEGWRGEHHPSLPEVCQGQYHHGKRPASLRSPHLDRQKCWHRLTPFCWIIPAGPFSSSPRQPRRPTMSSWLLIIGQFGSRCEQHPPDYEDEANED